MSKDRINAKRKLLRGVASVLLAMMFMVAQVSIVLATPQAACLPGAGASVPSTSAQTHQCCCGETNACCCDMGQGPTAAWPDMGLAAVSYEAYNPAPSLLAVADSGVPSLLLPHMHRSVGRWTGAGPPLILSYLVNLTFRC